MFLSKLFTRLNAGRRERYLDEVAQLRPLPEQRLDSLRRERVRVSPGSLVTVHRNIYSVHSRLIGEMVEARVGPDTVEIWYADRKVEEVPRLRGRSKHRIDYRHIIDWLVRKPGAFENYRYRSDLFPTSWFRLAYDALREEHGPKRGAQEYLALLLLAARRGEALIEGAIRFLLGSQQALNAEEAIRLTEDNAPAPLTTIYRLSKLPRLMSEAGVQKVLNATPKKPADGSVHGSCRILAKALGISKDLVHRVWLGKLLWFKQLRSGDAFQHRLHGSRQEGLSRGQRSGLRSWIALDFNQTAQWTTGPGSFAKIRGSLRSRSRPAGKASLAHSGGKGGRLEELE